MIFNILIYIKVAWDTSRSCDVLVFPIEMKHLSQAEFYLLFSFPKVLPNSVAQWVLNVNYESVSRMFESCMGLYIF